MGYADDGSSWGKYLVFHIHFAGDGKAPDFTRVTHVNARWSIGGKGSDNYVPEIGRGIETKKSRVHPCLGPTIGHAKPHRVLGENWTLTVVVVTLRVETSVVCPATPFRVPPADCLKWFHPKFGRKVFGKDQSPTLEANPSWNLS